MAAPAPQGLPRETFAKLSPHPYLLSNLRGQGPSPRPIRVNGREPSEARPINVNTSPLTHAHGSALVRVGDNTAICGVRGEILHTANIPNFRGDSTFGAGPDALSGSSSPSASSELRDYDLLVPNIELATGSAPQFLPGAPPTTLAQTLSTRVYSLLHSSGLVDPADLRIWHTKPSEVVGAGGEPSNEDEAGDEPMDDVEGDEAARKVVIAYWVLYIDIYFISFDGNPFDVAWAAMLAALRNTKLPRTKWDLDREMVICSREDPKPLNVLGFPIACSAAVFVGREGDGPSSSSGEAYTLLDPDTMEESLCDENVTAVVDRSSGETRLLSISKHGGTALQPQLLREYVGVAERRWEEFRKVISPTS